MQHSREELIPPPEYFCERVHFEMRNERCSSERERRTSAAEHSLDIPRGQQTLHITPISAPHKDGRREFYALFPAATLGAALSSTLLLTTLLSTHLF